MNITLSLYLLSVVDGLLDITATMAFLSGMAGCTLTMIKALDGPNFPEGFESPRKLCLRLALGGLLISSLVPDQKGLLMIFGGTEVYKALQSQEAREIGGKSLRLLNQKLDEALADPKPEKGDPK